MSSAISLQSEIHFIVTFFVYLCELFIKIIYLFIMTYYNTICKFVKMLNIVSSKLVLSYYVYVSQPLCTTSERLMA